MNLIKIITVAGALIISTSTMAEGGGDIVFEKMMQANQVAMETYAAKQGKSVPIVKEYNYGMKLDVANVVNVTPPIKSCGAVPTQMTYEDAQGQLNTVRYNVAGECRNRGS